MASAIKCNYVNLNHAYGSTGVFSNRFVQENLDIGLVQEPLLMGVERGEKGFRVIGLPTNVGKLVYCQEGGRPRAVLLLSRRVVFHPLTEFMTSDLVSTIVDC